MNFFRAYAPLHHLKDESIASILAAAPAADAADTLAELDNKVLTRLLTLLPLTKQAAIVSYLPLPRQAEIIEGQSPLDVTAIFQALPSDEQADVLKLLRPSAREKLLPVLSRKERKDLLTLAGYTEETVGSITNTDFVAAPGGLTAGEALDQLRKNARDRETIYIRDGRAETGRLGGTGSWRELGGGLAGIRVDQAMRPDPVIVRDTDHRKAAVEKIQRYDLLALPMVGETGKMLGIVTVDDAMGVGAMEDRADLARFGGSLLKDELDLRHSRLKEMFGVRFFWLALLTIFGVLTSNVVAAQEALLDEVIILAAFLAPIIDMGGNTGSQSATLVIRAMALGQVSLSIEDFLYVLKRDFPVAVLLGISLALLECGLAAVSKGVGLDILLTVGLSMFSVTMAGSLIGLLLPFGAKKIGVDPATLSAPMITSLMDIIGVSIYFSFAYVFLAEMLA